jgi:amt: ammonium transporter
VRPSSARASGNTAKTASQEPFRDITSRLRHWVYSSFGSDGSASTPVHSWQQPLQTMQGPSRMYSSPPIWQPAQAVSLHWR